MYYKYQIFRSFAQLEKTEVLFIDTQDIDDLFNKLLELMPKWEGDVILGKSDEKVFNPEA